MFHGGISHAQLMRESTDRVEIALHGKEPHEQTVASRILDDVGAWQRWESEHSRLMRRVADSGRLRDQLAALKQTAFQLIHRKALFEYLRDNAVRGTARMRILTHFHPARGYSNALVAEHGVYLRSFCSHFCANYIGGDVAQDLEFLEPMRRYEELYAQYFAAYCSVYFRAQDGESDPQAALLPLIKQQLDETRRAFLDPRRERTRFNRELELRRRTGDTQPLDVRSLRAKLAR
jgi:hypothetical protein